MANEARVTLTPVTQPKKSKLKLILIIVLIPLLGTGGFLGWQYFSASPTRAASAGEGPTEANDAEQSESTGTADHSDGERGGAQSTVLSVEPFLVNLADRDTSRYLRVTIRLQLTSKSAAEKIASADVLTSQMRDAILGILSSRNSDQIITNEGKDQLKTEITEKLNAFLSGKPVKAVFFTDFVVQL
jgi:flagellar FliL protein